MKINKDNYLEYLLRYLDEDLSEAEKIELENFLANNSEARAEWDILRSTIMVPDETIVYPFKEKLFREEISENRPGRAFGFYATWITAAAAAIICFFFYLSWNSNEVSKGENSVAKAGRNNQGHFESNRFQNIENTPPTRHETDDIAVTPKTIFPVIHHNKRQNRHRATDSIYPNQINHNNDVAIINKPPVGDSLKISQPEIIQTHINVPPIEVRHFNSPSNNLAAAPTTRFGKVVAAISHTLHIKKEIINNQTYYAFTVETSGVSISKRLRADF